MNFNPRAYVRHDGAVPRLYEAFTFQSTCLREARQSISIPTIITNISIHVPT